ncbi:MAG TPA: ABC transporter permease [Acidimicrobiales bacterium]|nr:ABC transporter permease [Acidimicrobiales bacterium]
MSALAALVGLMVRTTATRGRIIGLASLGLVAVVVAGAVGASDPTDVVQTGAELIDGFGLSVLAPVVVLVFATATLGDPIEDGTLVYLWLRPVPRATLALAAALATLIVSLPLVVVPLGIAAALTGAGDGLVLGTIAASAVVVIGYTGIFVALGSWLRRALAWGIVYVLIWEGFIARASDGTARLAVRSYGRSLIAAIADVELELGTIAPATAVVVPLLVGGLGLVATTVRLRRGDVA